MKNLECYCTIQIVVIKLSWLYFCHNTYFVLSINVILYRNAKTIVQKPIQ